MNSESDFDELNENVRVAANVIERTPRDVEQQILSVSPASPLEELCSALDASAWLLARAKSIDGLMKQIAISWIERNGDFSIGDNQYSVGFSIAVKCLDVPQTGHVILQECAGDFDHLFSMLVAQPYKHAAVRGVINKKHYNNLFMPYRTGRLVNGVPEQILKRSDKRFQKKSAR